MSNPTYVDAHPLRIAFIANQLDRLAELIVGQGDALLRDAGIEFPPRAVSAVLLIGEKGEISAADIAELLRQPHQVVTQRVELLIEMRIIERFADPRDRRRKTLKLTDKGRDQHRKLTTRLESAANAFAALFKEIECDLSRAVQRADEALNRTSLLERAQSFERRSKTKKTKKAASTSKTRSKRKSR